MTKKTFKETAEILRSVKSSKQRTYLALRFADMFKASNPRFDYDAFMYACDL